MFLYKINTFLNRNKGILTVAFLVVFFFTYYLLKTFFYSALPNTISYTASNFNTGKINIPANLNFCNEKIPSNNFEIQKSLEKEFFNNNYWKNNSTVLFAKAQKWFPYIEPILKQQGVPDDFKYLAVIESHLSNINSPAGAAGFWQLVPNSARGYNLEVNQFVDERYDVEKATLAACNHIKDAYLQFKNWTLSAAAYNMGINGIQNALKQQNTNSYFDLLLNAETNSFVYRIVAYKTLFSSPAHFGIKKKKWNYFQKIPMQVFKIDSAITNLSHLAKHLHCNKATIKFFNPWLLGEVLPNPNKKTYTFKIPKNLKTDYSSYIKDLIGEDANINYELEVLPETAISSKDSVILTKKIIYHIVTPTDNLTDLAQFYEVTEQNLRTWNNIKKNKQATAGQTLSIVYFIK